MYDIRDLETSNLLYDPKKQEELERLRNDVPEFTVETDLNNDNVARYVILMYDKDSPMRKEYPKIRERKAISAQYAGFKISKTNRKFKPEVQQMLIGKNLNVNSMVIKYILIPNDPDQLALEMYYEMYQGQAALIFQGISEPEKHKASFDVIEKLRGAIKELTEKKFGGQDDEMLIRELYKSIESVREMLMPEYVAKKIADGEGFPYNPYANYEPEPLELADEEEIFKDE